MIMVSNTSVILNAVTQELSVPCRHFDPNDIAHCELQKPTVTLCSGCLVLGGVKCERYSDLLLNRLIQTLTAILADVFECVEGVA
jgi:hypothetical protein